MAQTIIIHHSPTIISSILTFTTIITPKLVQNIIIPSHINTRKLSIYCSITPLSPKGPKKHKMRMVQKPWKNLPCTIKYHGSENLGSSYKYIVNVSPQQNLDIPYIFWNFLSIISFRHTIPHCMSNSLHVTLNPFF